MKKELTLEQKKARAAYAKEWNKKNPKLVAENARRTRLKNKDKIREGQKAWLAKNSEKHKKKSREWYHQNKDRIRNNNLKKNFNISLEKYTNILKLQNNRCAICLGDNSDAKGKIFAVDHCHKTGKIRGLLCRGCNVGIGNLKDNPELLEKAAMYIRNNS